MELKEFAQDTRNYARVVKALLVKWEHDSICRNATSSQALTNCPEVKSAVQSLEATMHSVSVYGRFKNLLCPDLRTDIKGFIFVTDMFRDKWIPRIDEIVEKATAKQLSTILDPALSQLRRALSLGFESHCGSGFLGLYR